jgi:hypothetical protein
MQHPLALRLEDGIMECWNITSDMKVLEEYIESLNLPSKDTDKLLNIIIGVRELYDIKFTRLFESFEESIRHL